MPSSVVIKNLCWSTPDGTALFKNLDLGLDSARYGIVGRNGAGKTTLLRLISGELKPQSGHVSVSGTHGLMRQEVLPDGSQTVADIFGVTACLAVLQRAETGIATIEELAQADWTLPARMEAALSGFGLALRPETRLAQLSGGQITRVRLAALILAEPDVLLLDEPDNNLDRDGRQALADFIRQWRGCVIVVSHDRALLEEMDAIIELHAGGATCYGGNFSFWQACKAHELETARHDLAFAEKALAATQRRAQQASERKARRDSAGHRARAKGGQPKISLNAAQERAEASAGANARLRAAQQAKAMEALSASRARIEVIQPVKMDIPPTGLLTHKPVLRVEGVSFGYDDATPLFEGVSLSITGPERLAITGPNGCGKTTLLRLITGELAPTGGRVERYAGFALLDQHVSLLVPELPLRDSFMALHPAANDRQCRAALARFGFRADDALKKAGALSGGQRLRAGLACVLGCPEPPALLVLDEPTNHLDLETIGVLEVALQHYDGAVVVVSHDDRFLEHIRIERTLDLAAGVRQAAT